MRNANADGTAEDLIRSLVQTGCAEVHAKTLFEKFTAEMENGIIDIEDNDIVEKQIGKIEAVTEQINELAQLRRRTMLRLFELFEGDEDERRNYWCLIKHTGIAAYTLFEAYQSSEDDRELLQLAYEANKAFVKALSQFLGMEPVDCAACFSDLLKSKGE